jgi:hypothetical protein
VGTVRCSNEWDISGSHGALHEDSSRVGRARHGVWCVINDVKEKRDASIIRV